MVDGGCEMSGCNVRGALGSQARIGEVRLLQVGFEFRRIQKNPNPTRDSSLSWSLSWSLGCFAVATHDPWSSRAVRERAAPEAWGRSRPRASRRMAAHREIT